MDGGRPSEEPRGQARVKGSETGDYFHQLATVRSAPRKRARIARTIRRIIKSKRVIAAQTSAPAIHGWRVANQVRNMAMTSSPVLRAALENGSGEGVTAARAAVFPPWATRAINPPASVASNCSPGESWAAARHASKAAIGTLINVCRAFQTRSKAGILSAKNSIAKRITAAPITYQLASSCSEGGRWTAPDRDSNPRVATVA